MRINRDKNEIISKIDDWDSTLYKRGFEQIVTDFLLAVKTDRKTQFTTQDALITHQICEDIVAELNKI
jgi:virulence factor